MDAEVTANVGSGLCAGADAGVGTAAGVAAACMSTDVLPAIAVARTFRASERSGVVIWISSI